jgi:methenyltetrahydromethanopterin cyclohydrolase
MLCNYSVNEAAVKIIEEEVLLKKDFYNIDVISYPNGSTVLDFGIVANAGSWSLGRLFAEIAMGGLGSVSQSNMWMDGLCLPAVQVEVEHPVEASLSCHVGWRIPYGDTVINVQGPIRSIKAKDRFSKKCDYRDRTATKAVAVLQSTELPDEAFMELLASEVDMKPEQIYMVVARTGNLTGAVQVCARTVEQCIATISETDFNLKNIIYATGLAVVSGISSNDVHAMGLINNSLLYGQVTNLFVRCSDAEIEEVIQDLPMNRPANKEIFGTPFEELFEQCGNEWTNVPRNWDAPSCINFINVDTGKNWSVGELSKEVILGNWNKA